MSGQSIKAAKQPDSPRNEGDTGEARAQRRHRGILNSVLHGREPVWSVVSGRLHGLAAGSAFRLTPTVRERPVKRDGRHGRHESDAGRKRPFPQAVWEPLLAQAARGAEGRKDWAFELLTEGGLGFWPGLILTLPRNVRRWTLTSQSTGRIPLCSAGDS